MSRYSGSAHYFYSHPGENTTIVLLDFQRDGRSSTLKATRQIDKDSPAENYFLTMTGDRTSDIKLPQAPFSAQTSSEHLRAFNQELTRDLSDAFIGFMDDWRYKHPELADIRPIDHPEHDDIELFQMAVERLCRRIEAPALDRSPNAPSARIGIAERVKSWITGR